VQVRCDQRIRAAVAEVRRTVCDVQIKEEVVEKKVKKDEALQNYRLQISNLAALESRIRHTFRDIEQVVYCIAFLLYAFSLVRLGCCRCSACGQGWTTTETVSSALRSWMRGYPRFAIVIFPTVSGAAY
jgi:hypothetical protein